MKGGANLCIETFSYQLEAWSIAHEGKFPEKIFWQIDGGSENANRYVLGFCELLIANGIIREILLTRLPVGHTHEDIDQKFGILGTHCMGKPIWSPKAYCIEFYKAFKDYELPSKLIDLFFIHNWNIWLQDSIDKKFAK